MLEDDQVELLASRLDELLSKGLYSHNWFYKVIRISLDLIKLGFLDDGIREKLLDSLRLAVKRDPKCNVAVLRQKQEMEKDIYGTEANLIMDKLIAVVEQDEIERAFNRDNLKFSIVDMNTGKTISTFFEEAIKSEYQNRILDVPAGTVATAIYEGAADSQMSLYSFFHTGMKNYAEKQSMNEAIEWLKNIDTQLVEMGSKSRTGTLRTNWIHNDIKQAIESLSKRAQDTSTDSDVDM